jgi:hypothetical protein
MKPNLAAELVWQKLRAFTNAEGHAGEVELLKCFDADGSVTLDKNEFKAALATVGLPGTSIKGVESVMKAASISEGAQGSKMAPDYTSFALALQPRNDDPAGALSEEGSTTAADEATKEAVEREDVDSLAPPMQAYVEAVTEVTTS